MSEVGTEREAAPTGGLELVRAFLNTVDIEGGEEQLRSPGDLAAWLEERGLLEPGPPAGEADLRLAIEVREGLRALAFANHDHKTDADAMRTLDRLASAAPLRIRFTEEGARLEPSLSGIPGALGSILAAVYASHLDGTWPRFKACRRSTCRWAFYDVSRNRSRSWCSMAVCGNREKAKAFRRRRTEESRA